VRLEPWQEKQLLLAAASSKKKMQVRCVTQLASYVLWAKRAGV
jgi:hypothetical protein